MSKLCFTFSPIFQLGAIRLSLLYWNLNIKNMMFSENANTKKLLCSRKLD